MAAGDSGARAGEPGADQSRCSGRRNPSISSPLGALGWSPWSAPPPKGYAPRIPRRGAAGGWRPVLERGGPYVPCFDPDAAPALVGVSRSFGLALPPGPPSARAGELASGGGCVLATHTRELAGVVPSRELTACAAHLREAAA